MTKDYIFCTECGTKNKETSKFCRKCGNKLEKREIETEASGEVRKDKKMVKKEAKSKGNKKLIGIVSVVLIVALAVFLYIRNTGASDGIFDPASPKEEVWVGEDDIAVKMVGEEVWLMAGYSDKNYNPGSANLIFNLLENPDGGKADSTTFKTDDLKRLELPRYSSLGFFMNAETLNNDNLEIFNVNSDTEFSYLGEVNPFFDEVIEKYLEEEKFLEILNKHQSSSPFIDQQIGTSEKVRGNLTELLYNEEMSKNELKDLIALETELGEAIFEENKELIKTKIQEKQAEVEEEFTMTEEEIVALENEMRAEGLEVDDFNWEVNLYLDEEKLDLVLELANLSNSAIYSLNIVEDDVLLEKRPADHPDNDHGEEILIVTSIEEPEKESVLFKEE